MTSVTIDEAKANLSELIDKLAPGDEVTITRKQQPVARLIATTETPQEKPRTPGTLRGTVLSMAPDFDAPLEEFREYME